MNKLFLIIGMLVVVMGLLWIGQGLGYVKWPATSFMISQIKWTYYGCGLVVFGIITILLAKR
jgi:uncharacterized membrane protein